MMSLLSVVALIQTLGDFDVFIFMLIPGIQGTCPPIPIGELFPLGMFATTEPQSQHNNK